MHRMRVAPDGMLNLVPFGALTDARGHFLIAQFAICYISAGRDLAGPALPGHPTGPMIIAQGAAARRRRSDRATAEAVASPCPAPHRGTQDCARQSRLSDCSGSSGLPTGGYRS